jgi:hypothetical protein
VKNQISILFFAFIFVFLLAFFLYIYLIFNNNFFHNSALTNQMLNTYKSIADAYEIIYLIICILFLAFSYLNPQPYKALIGFILLLFYGFIYASIHNFSFNILNSTQNIFLNTTIKNTLQSAYAFVFSNTINIITFLTILLSIIINMRVIT